MKVLDGQFKGAEPGSKVDVSGYGLPVKADRGLLIVFWKTR